jgi:hypothetical protein
MNPRGGRASAFHGRTSTIFADSDYAVRDSRFKPGEHLPAHEHDTAMIKDIGELAVDVDGDAQLRIRCE